MTRAALLWTILSSALGLTLLTPATTQAQSIPDSAFDATTNAELRRILADSYGAGLPEAPLLNRIRQGAARHVDGARVVALVRAHADSMRAARVALGAGASADELDAGASALHAGASRAALHRLRTVRGDGTATTAIVVLTDLLWRGVPSRDAADAITQLASRSNDKALLALQGAVARDATPASPQRLQSLVDRFAIPPADQPSRAGAPSRRPVPPDTLPDPASQESATPLTSATGAALALSSLSAPGGSAPHAVLGEGEVTLPLGRVWSVTPATALRLDEDGTRWSAGLSVARQLQPAATVDARLWLGAELRSPVAHARGELPITDPLEVTRIPDGRSLDVALRAGADVRRRVGPWSVTGQLAVGHLRFSSLETILVPRQVPIVPDSQTPRPDTLATRTVFDPQNVWRALGASTAQGGLVLQRGAVRLEGSVVRRLDFSRTRGDSLSAPRRTLLIVGGERRLSARVAVVGQWSSHDPSVVTGSLALHDARWRLGFRMMAPAPASHVIAPPRRVEVETKGGSPLIELQLEPGTNASVVEGARTVRLRVKMRGARTMLVEGDLTGWAATPLSREQDGSFSGTFVVAGPIVRLRVRADGGPWVTPPGVPTQRDDFGDLVAVYVLAD